MEEKERLAEAALARALAGDAVFVDCSTTAYFAARRVVRENFRCTLLTNAVPIMELVSESESAQVDLIGMGGTLRKLTRSFVGPQAVAGIETHFADQVVFSVAGLTDEGHLTDPTRSKRRSSARMIHRARRAILLVDESKFDRAALSVIAERDRGQRDSGRRRFRSVADARLRRAGVEVSAV